MLFFICFRVLNSLLCMIFTMYEPYFFVVLNQNIIMKTKLLFLLFFSTLFSFSQQDIEQLQSATGSEYLLTTGTIDQSSSGANASWDFTSLTNTTTVLTDTYTVMLPASTIETTDGSTIISRIGLNTDINNVISVTSALSSGIQLNYSDTGIIGAFPLSFGYSSTDAVEGTFTGTFSGDVLSGSTLNVDVDAWGNLKVGTFDGEVTRLKVVQNLNLSTIVPPLPVPVTTTGTQTSYFYYDANNNDLVFRTTLLEVPLVSINEEIMETLISYTLDNNEYQITDFDIKLKENPVNDILSFEVKKSININSITISDISGRIVLETDTISSSINVNQLNSGLFVISFKTDKGISSKKFIKK